MGILDTIGDAARSTTYIAAVRNLIFMTSKPTTSYSDRGGTAIDEIVLHGTESTHDQAASSNALANSNDRSIHYFIGRGPDYLYSIVPEDKAAWHAGNPHHVKGVLDHNPRSIGIEMYDTLTNFDFTDWQYDTVAMLVYDIRRRRGIARNKVVSHASINSVERADPRNFDWDRFNRRVDDISNLLGGLLGPAYRLDISPLTLMQVKGW